MRAQSYFFFLNEKNGINSQIVSEFPCHLTLWIVQFNKRDEKINKTKTNVCIKKKTTATRDSVSSLVTCAIYFCRVYGFYEYQNLFCNSYLTTIKVPVVFCFYYVGSIKLPGHFTRHAGRIFVEAWNHSMKVWTS